jgi:tetratricopeptide (TPR) repeat protein
MFLEAIEQFTDASKRYPNNITILKNIAVCYYYSVNYEKAAETFNTVCLLQDNCNVRC